jgi:hypothetical protein
VLALAPCSHKIPIATAVPAVQFNKVFPPQRRCGAHQAGFGGG